MLTQAQLSHDNVITASVGRRLGATLYDSLLIIALWFLATGIALAVLYAIGVDVKNNDPLQGSFAFQVYLLMVWFMYYSWSICYRGQTLGMRAWRIKLVDKQFHPLGLGSCSIRFVSGFFGLSHLSCWLDKNRQAFHDKLSGSMVVLLKKN